MSVQPRSRRDDALLDALQDELMSARSDYRTGRNRQQPEQRQRAGRVADAMSRYAAAAAAAGIPLPYGYRHEMQLYRSLSRHPT